MKDFKEQGSMVSVRELSQASRGRRQQLFPWLFDVASLLLSLICIVIVVALLRYYDGKPRPQWGIVTFNAMLSVLAQTAKACLAGPLAEALSQLKWHWFWDTSTPKPINDFSTYDAATRGPRGALTMLSKTRLWSLSSLGALLVILAVTTEPFLQQIPSYPIRQHASNEPAVINRATYFLNTVTNPVGGDHEGIYTSVLDARTKGAFYSGLYRSTGPDISPFCRTGNCTWAPYTSLAVCSACADISSTLKSQTEPGYGGMAWMWTAPNGLTGQSTYTAMTTSNGLPTIKFAQLQKYSIVDTTSMNFGAGTGTMDSATPEAAECVLYFCVNTYHAVTSNGTLTEEIVSSFPNASTSTAAANAAIYEPSADFTFNPQLVRNGTFVTDKHPKGAVYASNPAVNSTIKPPGDDQAYKIDGATLILIREWAQKTLDGSVSRLTDPKTPIRDVAQVLFAEGLIPACRRIATSWTAEIRNLASEHAVGTTQVAEVYVHVRWEWLILPAAVLALTLVFMSVTVVLSMMKDVPMWKSSPLPVLIYSLDQECSSVIAVQGPVLSKLEKEAGQYSMALSKEQDLWHLEGVERKTSTRADDTLSDSLRRRK